MAGRLTIIGGGVMGLMTAYQAAPLAESVTVLDRSRVGDPATASFGLVRSVRNDYRTRTTPGSRSRPGGCGATSSGSAAGGCWWTAAA